MRESTWRTATHRAQPTHTADQDKPRWRSRGGQTGPQPLAEGHASGARHSVFVSRAKLENHHFRLAHFGCPGRIGHQSKAVRRPRLQAVRVQPCLPLRGDAKRQSGGGFVPAQGPPRGKRSAQQHRCEGASDWRRLAIETPHGGLNPQGKSTVPGACAGQASCDFKFQCSLTRNTAPDSIESRQEREKF